MFLVLCLLVLTLAYACGAVVAEAALASAEERAIPGALRAAIGFLLAIAYFAAAWQLVSIQQAWLLGFVLLALHVAGNWPAIAPRVREGRWRRLAAEHARGYVACVACAAFFFAPLFMVASFGPFTEGSGDITIYSDTPKLLTDGRMTAFGQPSRGFEHVLPNLRSLLDLRTHDRYARYHDAQAAFIDAHRDRYNPPAADYQTVRAVADIFFTSIYYAPYAMLYFASGETNYPAYFGVQAFLYAVMAIALWATFAPHSRRAAWVAAALVVASHGAASVFYNGYSMQALCLAISALVLYLSFTVRPLSVAGLRCYGCAFAIVFLCYTHFISVIAPLLAIGLAGQFRGDLRGVGAPGAVRASGAAIALRSAAAWVFAALVVLLVVSGGGKAIEFVTGLVSTLLHGAKSVYLGDRIEVGSLRWSAMLFGAVSQQHLHPFARETVNAWLVISASVAAGVAATLVGLRILVAGVRQMPLHGVAYAVLVATAAVHHYLAQSSLYTQAKGAQDVLPLIYAALVIPFAIGERLRAARRVTAWVWLLAVLLVTLVGALAAARFEYGRRLAMLEDRGAILEASYFAEAARIRREDPQALVLFEPRKSADLYLANQSFAGARMVPIRHQSLDRVVPLGAKTPVRVFDLIAPSDVPHLWMLSASRQDGRFTWHARRVGATGKPVLLFFGDDYERDLGERPRSSAAGDVGLFTYVRNGDAVLYLPAGTGARVELRIEPRVGGGGSAPVQASSVDVPRSESPALVLVGRFPGEAWVNAQIQTRE